MVSEEYTGKRGKDERTISEMSILLGAKIPHHLFLLPVQGPSTPCITTNTSPTMPKKRKSTSITVSAEAVSPLDSSDATADTSMLTTIELQENNRQKAAIASIAGQFLCSIGKKLPLDPVVAEVSMYKIAIV